jgi:Tol biopolymer transport system component
MKNKIKILLLFCSLIPNVGCEKSNSDLSGSDYKILFLSRRIENSGEWEMYIMNKDGSNQRNIVDLSVTCNYPIVSHNYKKIAFVHLTETYNYELYIINIDGTGKQLIDSSNHLICNPCWSLDNTKLIYAKSTNDKTSGIFECNYSNHLIKKISDINSYYAAYSPDGKTISYCENWNISLIDTNGLNKRNLILNAGYFRWSPGGNKIAYQTLGNDRSAQISVANADGSEQTKIADNSLPNWDSGFPPFGNYQPQWSPDESKIVYVSEAGDGLPEIHIMQSDGSNKLRLTNTVRRNEYPVFTPGGNHIVFTSNRDLTLGFDIYIMDIYGNNQVSVSKFEGDDCYPVIVRNN